MASAGRICQSLVERCINSKPSKSTTVQLQKAVFVARCWRSPEEITKAEGLGLIFLKFVDTTRKQAFILIGSVTEWTDSCHAVKSTMLAKDKWLVGDHVNGKRSTLHRRLEARTERNEVHFVWTQQRHPAPPFPVHDAAPGT